MDTRSAVKVLPEERWIPLGLGPRVHPLTHVQPRPVPVLPILPCPAEVVLVDDGTTDGSFAYMHEWARIDSRVRVVALSRNFGHQIALTAGIREARGDAVVAMDADLQDPPELIPDRIERYREG